MKDPNASCGNCLHMFYSFEQKTRFCKLCPMGDPVRVYDWCPDWAADLLNTQEELQESEPLSRW